VLSKPLLEELVHGDGGLVAECVDEEFVHRFDEAIVALGKQIELVLAHELSHWCREDQKAVVDQRQES